ncbi:MULTISPECIES: phosphonate ABC transporter ATP-binding protein [unclassified Spiroplasma]|uniref:phosphonate ABC transporter ATP-binding protein n=1 Tax=unclassified Spiroplasma TaxID=2637901 RepID=UPI0030D2AF3A
MIKFENVNKVWPNGVHALKDVNLQIYPGEFVGVIGLSGAGKTTLLRTINKMNTISSGKITIELLDNNKETKKFVVNKLIGRKLRRLRMRIGLIFQSYNNIGTQSVLKNTLNARVAKLPFFYRFFGFFSKKDKMIALSALEQLDILDKAYVRCGNLSGGQQQRVALARTLTQQPDLIIADEPVSALDPILANQVMLDFKKININNNLTVIINIHHVELALKYATRIIGIKDGQIVYDGSSKDVTPTILKNIYGNKYEKVDIKND